MAKIELLNNGLYVGLENVTFPVIVDGCSEENDCGLILHNVSAEELWRVGANKDSFIKGIHYSFDPEAGESRLVPTKGTTNA